MHRLNIESLEKTALDPSLKGLPLRAPALRVEELRTQGWSLLRQDVPLPAAVLKESALARNSRWMKHFLERHGCVICPHGKTTMAPQLFQRQLDDGAWGITAATAHQVQIYRRFGVPRILLANQLVDPRGIEFVLEELRADPAFDFYCLVDSMAGIAALSTAVERFGPARRLQVLLEVGSPGGRTGARTTQECLAIARAVARSGSLALRGVETYEAVFPAQPAEAAERAVRSLLAQVKEVARQSRQEGLFADGPFIVTAGGSIYFDIVAEELTDFAPGDCLLVLRSGCYLTHDTGLLERSFERLQARAKLPLDFAPLPVPALEVWGYIQSRPEPGKALATLGKRDVSFDFDLPRPARWFRPSVHVAPQSLEGQCRIVKLNDHHAHLELSDGCELAVGDMIGVGISHPCTTFDKWQLLYLVDDHYNVIGGVRTFF